MGFRVWVEERCYQWRISGKIYDLNLESWNLSDLGDWESWDLSDECRQYYRERLSWQQIIIVEGVTEIPECTFSD